MDECPISVDSSCEEVSEAIIEKFQLPKEDKEKFIKEGISEDVMLSLDISDYQEIGFTRGIGKKIKKYIEEHKDKFEPKEISEKIPIKNEEEIKAFFETYIGFKGNLEGIKEENDLKQLKEEDIKKLELNFGQRIKLQRYINYFYTLKETKVKEITITITKDSTDEEILNYLKNILNISDKSIENLGLDSDIADSLFGKDKITEKEINNSLKNNELKQDEYDMLKIFIEKRDEMLIKPNSILLSITSTKEDIIKYLKEKLDFDFEKQDIRELNLDKYENISKEEKKILENFRNQMIKKKYPIKIDSDINYSKMEKTTFQKDANYNIFFIFSSKNKSIFNFEYAAFQSKGNFLSPSYINYCMYLINKSIYNSKDDKYFLLLFQIASDVQINKISINAKEYDINSEAQIIEVYESVEIKNEDENYFIFKDSNYFPKIRIDDYFNEYLDYFFDEKIEINKIIKSDLIKILNHKIAKTKDIKLSAKNILRFLQYCGNYQIEPEKLDNIKISKRQKELDKKYYLSKEYINDNFKTNDKEMIYTILMKIYSMYDFDELLKIIEDEKLRKLFFKLYLVSPCQIETIKVGPSVDKDKIQKLQNYLMKCADNLKDVENIINLKNDIEFGLDAIIYNLDFILKMVEKEQFKKPFLGFMLNKPKETDNIQVIFDKLKNLNYTLKSLNRDYYLLKIENIFEKMVDIYINKNNLKEYLLLKQFINLDNNKINQNVLNKYYDNIHDIGMHLIKENKMTIKEIIDFIKNQDYYYGIQNIFHPKREPEIFGYIKITNKCKNYKENIDLIKKNELYKLYDYSPDSMKDMFYNEFLKQIETINDMENIFAIFPSEYITKRLLKHINNKFKNLFKLADKNIDNFSYSVVDDWINFNYKDPNNGDLDGAIKVLNEFSNFTSKYYLYLLKKDNMKLIVNKIKNHIISFFIEQNNIGIIDERSLITLLKESPDDDFSLYFVKNIDTKILKETDFYTKNETPNFEFFKLFCENISKEFEEKLRGCNYIEETTLVKSKIIEDLKNKNIQFEKINGLISDDNTFFEKIKVLVNNNEEAEKVFKDLKESLEKCKQKFQQLELIMDYYKQFYKESKNDKFILIKNKLNELYNTDISAILAQNNFFKDNEYFNFDEALEDCKKIKYRNSKFFMAIYEKNKENYKKSEDDRFKESIKDYQEVLTNIITQKEKKLKFFEINNVHEILNIISANNYNLQEEINFTVEEFKNLNKEDYIKNELLNDLVNYSKKDKALKLLEGIKCFIEIFEEIKKIEKSEFFKEIENLGTKLALEDVSKEEITETINILLEKGFDINKETPVMKFYSSIKKDSIVFLKTLTNLNFEIRNLNEFVVENAASELQTSHIDNLIYVFEFFVKIFNDKEITSDKTLIEIFGKEMENNKDIWTRKI